MAMSKESSVFAAICFPLLLLCALPVSAETDRGGSAATQRSVLVGPATTGACCLPDATCVLLEQEECENQTNDGVYQGDDTTCDADCGACCYWQGVPELARRCVVTTQLDCTTGVWSEIVIDFEISGPIGATWSAPGFVCGGYYDQPPAWFCADPRVGDMGACCHPDGWCLFAMQGQCSWDYLGDHTVCEPNPCPPSPTEVTGWGKIKAGYR